MSNILCIESSTDICSICISNNGNVIAIKESLEPKSHSRLITILIDEVMKEAQLSFDDLAAVAVSAGPGSYTSLRIGVTTAKAIAYSMRIPLIGVCTLEALAHSIDIGLNDCIISMIDARRDEVYYSLFDSTYNKLLEAQPYILKEHSFEDLLDKYKTVHLVGNGAPKSKKWLQSRQFVQHDQFCTAVNLVNVATNKYINKEFEDVAYFTPNYIKAVNITKSKKAAF